MSLWKWILLIISGPALFLILSQITPALGTLSQNVWLKALLLLGGGFVILSLYALWIKIFEKRTVSELCTKRACWNMLTGLGIGILFICFVIALLALIGVYKIEAIWFDWRLMLIDFAALFIVAVSEEIIFRGFLFRMIRDRFNIVVAFIISSLLFGFIHLISVDLWTAIAISAEGGFMLAAAYNLRNNLWFPIGIHWAWNFTLGTVFGANVSGEI